MPQPVEESTSSRSARYLLGQRETRREIGAGSPRVVFVERELAEIEQGACLSGVVSNLPRDDETLAQQFASGHTVRLPKAQPPRLGECPRPCPSH